MLQTITIIVEKFTPWKNLSAKPKTTHDINPAGYILILAVTWVNYQLSFHWVMTSVLSIGI